MGLCGKGYIPSGVPRRVPESCHKVRAGSAEERPSACGEAAADGRAKSASETPQRLEVTVPAHTATILCFAVETAGSDSASPVVQIPASPLKK